MDSKLQEIGKGRVRTSGEVYIINEHRAGAINFTRRLAAVFLFEPPLFPCRGIATRITVRRAFLFARGRRSPSQLRGTLSIHLPLSPARETRRKRELRRLARGTFNTQHGVRQKHGSSRVVARPALSSQRSIVDYQSRRSDLGPLNDELNARGTIPTAVTDRTANLRRVFNNFVE